MRAARGAVGTMLVLMVLAATSSAAGDASGEHGAAPLANPLHRIDEAEVGTRDAIDVRLVRGAAGLEVEGRFVIDAPASVAWSVLTDYDGIERFVTSMRESRVARRGGDTIWVEQRAVGRVFLFTRKLSTTLRVHELPPNRIDFEDLLARDFRFYRGEWRIRADEGRTAVVYRLHADPAFAIPDIIARGLFRGAARDLLRQVRSEIERRTSLAMSGVPSGRDVRGGGP